MREHEKTAGGSRKGKKSRRRGFLFSSLCRPRSLLCVRVSNILCDGESSLYKRRYRPGIDTPSSHIPPYAGSVRTHNILSSSAAAPAQNYSKIFLFLLKPHVYIPYTQLIIIVFLLRPRPPRHRGG